jgi:hypothetical protein
MSPRLMLVLALAATACRGEGRSTPSESTAQTIPAAAAANPPPTRALAASAAVTSSASDPSPADECSPGQPISPATLSAAWPTRLGSRVRFKGHVDVSVDVMTAIVIASGHRFVVVASPDQLWQGDRDRSYTVMGSQTVSLLGRTTLPQLLLEPECGP